MSSTPQTLFSYFNSDCDVIRHDNLIFSADFHQYNALFELERLHHIFTDHPQHE